MKANHLFLLALFVFSLSGCTVNRYYYVAEEPIALYEFPSFSGSPVLTASIGDTVSTTGANGIKLGGSVPVEYAGYRFYAPSARARFLRVAKVRPKRDAAVPGIAYTARLRYNSTSKTSTVPSNYGYTPSTGQLSIRVHEEGDITSIATGIKPTFPETVAVRVEPEVVTARPVQAAIVLVAAVPAIGVVEEEEGIDNCIHTSVTLDRIYQITPIE